MSDFLDIATLRAMLLAALAHPWALLEDVAPGLAEAVARLQVRADSTLVHWAWLRGFLGFGGAK